MSPRILALCIAIALLLGALLSLAAPSSRKEPELRNGDIVLQTSRSSQSAAIQRATGSPYSHIGIIEVTAAGPVVIEARQPVTRTPWRVWQKRGVDGKVTVLRLPSLTPAQGRRVTAAAESFLGRPYDAAFEWDDSKIYCSELVEKAYDRGAGLQLGHLQRLDSLKLDTLAQALRKRFGRRVPGDRLLITPVSIAEDQRLTQIWSTF